MDDDELQNFVPFMKKRTSKATCSQSCISFSQRSSLNTKQLSLKCFLKPTSDELPRSSSQYCASTTNEATSAIHSSSKSKNSPKKRLTPRKRPVPGSKGFCPSCQVPFDSLNVLPGVHAASCCVSWKELEECPFGNECQALDVLHFRDFSHEKLAQLRASKEESSKRLMTSDSRTSDVCTSSKLGKGSIREQGENVLNSCQKVVKCLNFKGNVSYKDEEENCKYKQNCIKSSTVSCEDCSKCSAVESHTETCVEMNLSPPASSCDPSSKTPVKVNLTYNESGWQSMDVNMQSDAHLEEVALAVCDCIEMKCTVTDLSKAKCQRNLEQKLFVNLEDLSVSSTNQTVPPQVNKQVTILSSLKPDGGSTTKLDISVVSPPRKSHTETRTDKCVVSISDDETISTDFLDEEIELSRAKYVKNESAREKWKELMAGVKTKGFNSMSIMSSDSFSSSSERSGKKQCPFYKRIPDTTFVVDAFQYGVIPKVTHYFLSHFHADHYGGLRKSFNKPVVCSAVTARLVRKKLGVDTRYLNVIELDQPLTIRHVTITALDANHCPGSLMFLFQLLDGRNFLHVGDFRADPSMESYPCFWNLTIDKLFLDTTYCDPKYTFPTQAEIIAQVVQVCRQHLERNPATLILSGTYTIGKEKVFVGIAEALDFKIWVKKEKRKVLECLQDDSITGRLVDYPWEAQVHAWSMMDINVQSLKLHLQQCRGRFKEVLAFKPTGWELNMSGDPLNFKFFSNDGVTIYSVPYSEHSSFSELRRFVQFLKPAEIIPTVNMASASSRAAMQRHFKKWLSEAASIKRSRTQKQLTSYVRVTGKK